MVTLYCRWIHFWLKYMFLEDFGVWVPLGLSWCGILSDFQQIYISLQSYDFSLSWTLRLPVLRRRKFMNYQGWKITTIRVVRLRITDIHATRYQNVLLCSLHLLRRRLHFIWIPTNYYVEYCVFPSSVICASLFRTAWCCYCPTLWCVTWRRFNHCW